jgi:RNA polymerase sigma factor (sigma-70 family)
MDPTAGWPAAETLGRLVRDAQREGPDALNRLLAALRPAVLTFFQRRLPAGATDAEDLTQLALIRVAKALRRIDPERADGYVATVARNLLRTTYRERARDLNRHLPLGGELASDSWLPDGQAEYEELVLAVHRAVLTKLRRPLREIMTRVLDDQSQVQIADELQVNEVTVRTRLRRARLLLREELARYAPLRGSQSGGKRDLREGSPDRLESA